MAQEKNLHLIDSTQQLDDAAIERSRQEHGENILTPPERTPIWRQYLAKYSDPIIQILLVAAVISLVLAVIKNEYIETIGILVAIFLATTIGFIFEVNAEKRFRLLTKMTDDDPIRVLRHGHVTEIAKRDVVVGDIIVLETGDEIPADGDLLESVDMLVDESSLTGEPIMRKHADPTLDKGESTYPANRVLGGTTVMGGSGKAVIRAVGDETEMGHVARHSTEEVKIMTPLQQQLQRLAKMISKVGFSIAFLSFAIFLVHDIISDTTGVWGSGDYMLMAERVLNYFMMAVTLIVMAVPEGLPMAITLALALNMRRMLKTGNMVRNMQATETMGAVTVICTDKTGTLTQNKMMVSEIEVVGDEKLFAKALAVNTTAHLDDGGKCIGNPSEGALLLWLRQKGYDYLSLRESSEIVRRLPFSTDYKYMTTTILDNGEKWTFIKGAPEKILKMCALDSETEGNIRSTLEYYQGKAMRTLAFAYKREKDGRPTYQGIVGISDPIREEVPAAIKECNEAGIEVKIVTGDVKATAVEIARQIGVWNTESTEATHISGDDFSHLSDEEAQKRVEVMKVMSRARPTDKQRLVQMLQKNGEVVAVTGDGTNDAPALHYAQVGLSLGSGTSVAKNTSDITILDDSFKSIVKAVLWGRSLYRNIQRFLSYQLTINLTALLIVLVGSLVGTEMPLTVTQILWINLIMDTFAAMALASLPPSKEVLKEKPRKSSDFIINKTMMWAIIIIGLLFFAILFPTLYKFESSGGVSLRELTLFFNIFVMMQWWNLLNAKSLFSSHSAFRHFFWSPVFVLVMLGILVGQILIVQFGGSMFRVEPLSLRDWLLIIVCTSPVMIFGEIYRLSGLRRLFSKETVTR